MTNDNDSTLPQNSSSLVLPDQILPQNLFVLPITSGIIYPGLMAPIAINIPKYIATAEEALSRQRYLGLLVIQEGTLDSDLKIDDLYQFGVIAKIIKRIKLPDGSIQLLVQSIKRFEVISAISSSPHLIAEARYHEDILEKGNELDALTRAVITRVKTLAELNPFFTEEMRLAMVNAPQPGTIADIVAFALNLSKEDSQIFLETIAVKQRFELLLAHLAREQDVADLQRKIQDDVNGKLNSMQREYFLREQMKVIKRELGTEENSTEKATRSFRERIADAKLPSDIEKVALDELKKLETTPESSPEYGVLRNYLDTICSLPWSISTSDQLSLDRSKTILNRDHFGLERVKDRILEFLSVRILRGKDNKKGSILCLVGPPGVGKTSIGRSVAEALDRKYYRFSLGGMRDEAEIKGHRRTYVGAMPGKFIQAMKRAGSKNPVLLLDEIDKMSSSYHGDPASALLEVLDPEQNTQFTDHYLDLPFDLSEVLFIATANSLHSIPAPLLDRMEIIEIPGYTLEEKESIAKRYVIPKIWKDFGLRATQIKIDKEALRSLMKNYAREPGLRQLQQYVERIGRKAARRLVEANQTKGKLAPIIVREEDLQTWVGPVRYTNEVAERIDRPGIVTGLAWTSTGGDILFIEANDIPSTTGGLKLTGQMGEVMTESAAIAWSVAKKWLIESNRLTLAQLKDKEVHIHIPAGAIPKDGPSAGITMATALISLFSNRKFLPKVAMTGELSLTGRVLAIGGLKEKILAAKRVGITTIIYPEQNKKDLVEIPEYALKGMTLLSVNRLEEVLGHCLAPDPSAMKVAKQVRGRNNIIQKKNRTKTNVKTKVNSGKRYHA